MNRRNIDGAASGVSSSLPGVARILQTAAAVSDEEQLILSTVSPGAAQKRLALAVVLGLLIVFVLITAGPLGSIRTNPVAAFVPAYATAMFVCDSITAILLFAQFSILRSRANLVIASGYLFTALILIPWILAFPGVFTPGAGLIGGLQTTSWLYFAQHAGLPLFAIVYALSKDTDADKLPWPHATRSAITLSVALTAGLVSAVAFICVAGEASLPRVVLDSLHLSPLWPYAGAPVALLSLASLIVLWIRGRSLLDLWLMVVMCLYTLEIPLSYYPTPFRFSIGWYAVRVIGFLSSTLVLTVLLYEIQAIYAKLFDIEDRRRGEEVLQSNERNLSLIINTIPAHIYVLNTEGYVQYVNQAVMDYTGLSIEDVKQGDYRDRVIHPEDFKRVREPRAAGLRRGVPFSTEQRVLSNNRQYRWFLVRYKPLHDEQGRIVRWYVAAFDIEDRKRAEAEVEQAYLRLAQAQRVSKTGSFITDLLMDEHNWSEELCRIFEFNPGTRVTTEAVRARFHPEDLPVYEDAFKLAVDGDQDIDITYRIITPAGKVKHLHAVAQVLEKIAGRPVYIGAIQDMTESKLAEQALTRARAELAHMARVTTLSALTASIAHEINQPIAAGITSAGACLRWLNRAQPDVQRAREAAMRIEDDGKRAAEIIAHLRSFYKKEVSPQREMVSVNDLVEEMLALLRSEAERHSVVMRTELAAGLPSVSADRVLLQQVLMNLMLNGMEAMSERGGDLKISTRSEGGTVMVSVNDRGVGIPADKMEEIFNAFVTTKPGGTGMGLAISRTIIESHGGRLWATVNPESGATFHFTLPTELEA